jgi:hypothetical protein
MKIQKEFDPIQGTTTVRIEKTREDVTPVVTYKEFISKGIENADGEIVNQRLENVLPENVATTLFQETLSDGTDIKAAVAAVTAKATIEYAEKNGQRAVIEMKYRQPTGDAAEGTGSTGRTVATPRITISAEGSVTITASEGDVFYTTNGSNPTSSSTAYTAAFTVADGTVVKAIAVVTEADPETGDDVEYVSSVATKKYTAAGSSDPTPPSGSFVVYKGTPVLDYNRMENQNAVGAYFEEAITPELIKTLTSETVTNQYQDYSFTGTDEDDDHISTAVIAFPRTAEPIEPGMMFAGELKQSGGYHRFYVTIDGVEYVVFALKGGLADSTSTIEVFFRASFN